MKGSGICVLVLGLLLVGCARQDDVAFSRRILEGLINDRYAVRSMIDWQHLHVLDKNVGQDLARYTKTGKDQHDYEVAFIEGFSRAFRMTGAKISAFYNWRIFKKENLKITDPNLTVVAANCIDSNRVFLFVISHKGGKQKLEELFAFLQVARNQVPQTQRGKTDVAPAQP